MHFFRKIIYLHNCFPFFLIKLHFWDVKSIFYGIFPHKIPIFYHFDAFSHNFHIFLELSCVILLIKQGVEGLAGTNDVRTIFYPLNFLKSQAPP